MRSTNMYVLCAKRRSPGGTDQFCRLPGF